MDVAVVTSGADIDAAVERAADVLRRGGAIVLPTDTVYGLAALPTDVAAIERVFELKGRGRDTPLAVLCADLDQALGLVADHISASVRLIGARWWPGPLTLVAPRREGTHLHLGEPVTTIGVRVPDDALVRAIALRVGPLAATSANRHGAPTPTDARQAAGSLLGDVDLVVDGGERSVAASTVVDLTTDPPATLRAGPIDPADIGRLLDAIRGRDR